MPALADFVEEAKTALRVGDAERAEQVCRHVLQQYPRHVDANCFLAEAMRDRGRLAEARDLFLRVLSADPENVIAHWALSLTAEGAGDLDVAIWELERAWETSPGHPELYRELVRLTGERPQLTAVGLARLYIRTGTPDRAVEELRKVLVADPFRLDARVILAEALWHDGRSAEAARACEDVLEDSPDCLKANLLLGFYFVRENTARRKEGWRLLRAARSMDPDGRFAAALLGEQAASVLAAGQPPEVPEIEDSSEAAAVVRAPQDGSVIENASVAGSGAGSADDQTEPTFAAAEPDRSGPGLDGPTEPVEPGLASWLVRASDHAASIDGNRSRAAAAPGKANGDEAEDWSDLLNAEVTLDPEAAQRLDAALAEMGMRRGGDDQDEWVEIPAGQDGLKPVLDQLVEDRAVAQTEDRDAAAPDGDSETDEVDREAPESSQPERNQGLTRDEPIAVESSRPPQARPRDDVVPAELPLVDAREEPRTVPAEGDGAGEDPESRLARAHARQESGDWDAAVEEYRQLIRSSPHLVEGIVENLKWLIYASPSHAAAHRALGDAYMRCGRFQQAIDEYNWVLAQKRSTETAREP